MGDAMQKARGLTFDTPASVPSAFLMVTSVALFKDELFTGPSNIGRERIIDELTRMLTGALLYKRAQ